MSGVSFKIETQVDDREVQRVLSQLIAAGSDLGPAFADIGEAMILSTEERFSQEVDPDGRPWAPLAPATRARKRNPKILTESTNLRGRIVWQLVPDGVEWGTNVIYAAIHQFGGQTGRGRQVEIPARPFLGISADDGEAIMEILSEHLAAAAK